MIDADFPRDQNLVHVRIGFEKPLPCNNGPLNPDARRSYTDFEMPFCAVPGSIVPLVYVMCGYRRCEVTKWGIPHATGEIRYFKNAERRNLAYPCMIPASFIDLATSEEPGGDAERWVRLTPKNCDHLFIGCHYVPDQYLNAESLALLIGKPAPNLVPFHNWQPLLIDPNDSDFVMGRDYGRIQVPRGSEPSHPVEIDVVQLEDSSVPPGRKTSSHSRSASAI
jgi:hypothetical protein